MNLRFRSRALVWPVAALAILLPGCGDDDDDDPAAAGQEETAEEDAVVGKDGQALPQPVEVTGRGKYWAVYLATHPGTEPDEATRAIEDDAAYNFDFMISGPLACDQGAAEALSLNPADPYYAVAVYYDSEADARQVAENYDGPVEGVAEVELTCP